MFQRKRLYTIKSNLYIAVIGLEHLAVIGHGSKVKMTPKIEKTQPHKCPQTYFMYEWDNEIEVFITNPNMIETEMGQYSPDSLIAFNKYDWWDYVTDNNPKPGYSSKIHTSFAEDRLEELLDVLENISDSDHVIMAWYGESKIWDMRIETGESAKKSILEHIRS